MKYVATIMIENQLEDIKFETEDNPVEFLWTRYGMDSYIEKLEEVTEIEE